jgi:non-ribosomal peptide synthetase component F
VRHPLFPAIKAIALILDPELHFRISMQATNLRRDVLQTLSPTDQVLFSKLGLGETVELPFECIHHAFEFRARTQPRAVAVQDIDDTTTYAELDHQANCVANHLRKLGIVPNSRVGLLVERSIFMAIGILAILKTGAAYVPLDGNDVSGHLLNHAIKDSGSNIVLVQSKFAGRVTNASTVILEDSSCPHLSPTHCRKTQDLATGEDSACVIFTHGKILCPNFKPTFPTIYFPDASNNHTGVDLTHRNIINRAYFTSIFDVYSTFPQLSVSLLGTLVCEKGFVFPN